MGFGQALMLFALLMAALVFGVLSNPPCECDCLHKSLKEAYG